MTIGTSFPTAKALLLTALEARSWPAGTVVAGHPPRRASEADSDRLVFIDNGAVDIEQDIETMTGGTPVEFWETFELVVVCQAMSRTDAGTQAAADTAAAVLMAEVVDAVASDPTLGHTPTGELPQIDAHLVAGADLFGDALDKGGFGTRIALGVEVRAHIVNT
jgi:hypothetical protein